MTTLRRFGAAIILPHGRVGAGVLSGETLDRSAGISNPYRVGRPMWFREKEDLPELTP